MEVLCALSYVEKCGQSEKVVHTKERGKGWGPISTSTIVPYKYKEKHKEKHTKNTKRNTTTNTKRNTKTNEKKNAKTNTKQNTKTNTKKNTKTNANTKTKYRGMEFQQQQFFLQTQTHS